MTTFVLCAVYVLISVPWGLLRRAMQSKYDAVVIGAGPAGSSAAFEIASAGYSVLMLEKHKRPGSPLCCAEAVSKPTMGQYLKPEPEWISTYVHKIKLVSPGGAEGKIYHPDAGYVLDRKVFDNALAERAVRAGAELECEAIGLGVFERDGLYEAIDILRPDGSIVRVEARIFIAADGVESKIARLAGIDNLIDESDVESLLQYRVEGISLDPEMLEFYVGNEIAPRGYIWVFPKSQSSANVGLGISTALEKGELTASYLDRFMERRFGKDFNIIERHCGLVPRYQGEGAFRKGNLLVVGDAARAIDSLSGAGILNAIISGIYAGRASSKYLENGALGEKELDLLYPGEFLKLKGNELKMYSRLRNVYNKLSDAEFDDIIEYVGTYFGDRPVKSLNAINFLTNMITKRPKLIRLVKHLV